ncbi:calmodulin-alpha-like [Tubulanus polymorphus]|uniref:calmodulin-alpha-like n=1 Tax=Tubulanus polymorphus TaxID=672921 RepID=UPI003DA20A54
MADKLTEEVIAELKEAFTLFDDDGDGHITRTELAQAMRTMGVSFSDNDLTEMIEEIDEDGNGTIDFSEFLNFMAIKLEEAQLSDEVLMEAFNMIDHGNKGYLDPGDLKTCLSLLEHGMQLTSKEIESILREADLDQDGKITFQEFANIVISGRQYTQ